MVLNAWSNNLYGFFKTSWVLPPPLGLLDKLKRIAFSKDTIKVFFLFFYCYQPWLWLQTGKFLSLWNCEVPLSPIWYRQPNQSVRKSSNSSKKSANRWLKNAQTPLNSLYYTIEQWKDWKTTCKISILVLGKELFQMPECN